MHCRNLVFLALNVRQGSMIMGWGDGDRQEKKIYVTMLLKLVVSQIDGGKRKEEKKKKHCK